MPTGITPQDNRSKAQRQSDAEARRERNRSVQRPRPVYTSELTEMEFSTDECLVTVRATIQVALPFHLLRDENDEEITVLDCREFVEESCAVEQARFRFDFDGPSWTFNIPPHLDKAL